MSLRSLIVTCILVVISLHMFRQPLIDTVTSERKKRRRFPFQQELKKRNLHLSLRQQQNFHMNKDLVSEKFGKEMLYSADTNKWHSILLNKQFAYRHIFKNGGTTVEKQAHSKAVSRSRVGNRTLVAAVRDPLDHFLSGWQECGKRFRTYMEGSKTSDEEYDGRIQQWLNRTKSLARGEKSCKKILSCQCAIHSLPQANFLITKATIVDPNVRLVGDLHDLPGLLAVAGFQYDNSKALGRNALSNVVKQKHFPRKEHLIANDTMRSICEFLSLDYFLFDFELPGPCRTNDLI
jgi:hypothetical protein